MPNKPTRRPGQPLKYDAPMTRINVMLDAATADKAALLGGGNVSAGIRIAVKRARIAGKYTK